MVDSIELPSAFECLIAKSIEKDRDDSTEPFSDEDEYHPQDPKDEDEDDQCQAVVRRFSKRGKQAKDNSKAEDVKAQGSNRNAPGNDKPASTTKKTSVARPLPSNNAGNYSDSSERK